MTPTITYAAKIRQIAKALIPPLVWDGFRALRRSAGSRFRAEWEYVPQGWPAVDADPEVKGWNVASVLDAYRRNWPDFLQAVQGPGPLGLSPEASGAGRTSPLFHNILMSYGYALGRAARHKTALSLLDWGGGIGHYYVLSQALAPDLQIEYHCKDVVLLAEHGRTLFPQAHFYSDDSCLARQYDFVLASTSLHYSRDWRATLEGLSRATRGHLFVTRLPTTAEAPSYVFVQRPYAYGYDTEYAGWCLNRAEFLQAAAAAGLELQREFVIGEDPVIQNAPGACQYSGFLFSKKEGTDE